MGRVWVEFTQSSRKHRIGRERMRHVLANPVVHWPDPNAVMAGERVTFLGTDDTGRRLELVVVVELDHWVVIHAMDMRPKFYLDFERGQRS